MEIAKKKVMPDGRFAHLLDCLESEVFDKRYQRMGIKPSL